jgi:hypothetical protein
MHALNSLCCDYFSQEPYWLCRHLLAMTGLNEVFGDVNKRRFRSLVKESLLLLWEELA